MSFSSRYTKNLPAKTRDRIEQMGRGIIPTARFARRYQLFCFRLGTNGECVTLAITMTLKPSAIQPMQ